MIMLIILKLNALSPFYTEILQSSPSFYSATIIPNSQLALPLNTKIYNYNSNIKKNV